MTEIRLVVTDIEGCVIPGARRDWELEPLQKLRAYNQLAQAGRVPSLTLCSGRPAQYVEAVGQAVGVHLPMVCENGAVVYHPDTGRHQRLYTQAQREVMCRVRELVQREFAEAGRARVAEGKEVCVSLIPRQSDELPGLLGEVEELLVAHDLTELLITRSSVAVDITPQDISKATGVSLLLNRLHVPWGKVLGVGDGGNDLPFLTRCGYTATPANGLAAVRNEVEFTAHQPFCSGLLEILAHFTSGGNTS